jgi:hypothetical protein
MINRADSSFFWISAGLRYYITFSRNDPPCTETHWLGRSECRE